MNIKDVLILHNLATHNAKKLIDKKGHDYASKEDTLSNFKKQSIICQILELDDSPKAQAIRLLIVKLIRIVNLWKYNQPDNESELDSDIDAINYLILARALRMEELGIEDKLIAAKVNQQYKNGKPYPKELDNANNN